MPGNIRRITQNTLIAVGGVVVAVVVLELGARLLPSPFDGPRNTANVCSAELGWRGRPNFETTVATGDYLHDLTLNSAGMHDGEHQQPKPPDTFRILVLGDSFVRAHQVDEADTSHQVLENLLNQGGVPGGDEDRPLHYEVISGGVDAWGTGQQLLYYRSEGCLYQPDLVLLMFYIGNDVKDNLPGRGLTLDGKNCYMPFFVLCGGRLDVDPWLYAPGFQPPMGECSWAQKTALSILGRIHRWSRLYTQIEPAFTVNHANVAALDFFIGDNETFDYALELTLDLVEQLHQEVTEDGAQFRVVLISPSDLITFIRMDANEREAVYQEMPALRRAEEIAPPNQMLAETMAQDGVMVLDLLPIFSQHIDDTGGGDLHFPDDNHWNAAGNHLVGEAIYQWLQETREW